MAQTITPEKNAQTSLVQLPKLSVPDRKDHSRSIAIRPILTSLAGILTVLVISSCSPIQTTALSQAFREATRVATLNAPSTATASAATEAASTPAPTGTPKPTRSFSMKLINFLADSGIQVKIESLQYPSTYKITKGTVILKHPSDLTGEATTEELLVRIYGTLATLNRDGTPERKFVVWHNPEGELRFAEKFD